MDKKMIFLDLDGTLLDDEKQLPKENKEAIDGALALGHKVFICTGRPLSSTKVQIPILGLDKPGCYAITYNGGLIYDSYEQKIIYEKTLATEYVRHIFKTAHDMGVHIQTYSDECVICEEDDDEVKFYTSKTKMKYKVVKDVFEELGGRDPFKALAIAPGFKKEMLDELRERLEEYARGKMEIFFSCHEYLEFVPLGVSKGNAIHFMSDYLKIPMEDTIAVGDAENDITMLEEAHIGAVMKNAEESVKAYGNYVTTHTNNEGGVAEVIRKFMNV